MDCSLLQRELQEHYGEYRFWNVYSKIHNSCVQELGGHLDIIKDRQYTTGANSKAPFGADCAVPTAKRWCAGSRPTGAHRRRAVGTCRASVTSPSCSTPA